MAKPQNCVADHALIFDYPKVKKSKNLNIGFHGIWGANLQKVTIYNFYLFRRFGIQLKKSR